MFDYLPALPLDDDDPRLLGIRFLIANRASLARVVAGMHDGAAAALAYALIDMMIDPTVDPLHWPIEETIVILGRPCADRSGDAERLAGAPSRLRDAIEGDGA